MGLEVQSSASAAPAPGSDAARRTDWRARQIKLASIAQIAAKVIGLGMSVITVPLTLKYLGKDAYAIWLMMNSFVLTLVWADLGLSNGLLNIVADAEGRDDRAMAQRSVSTGLVLLAGIALTLVIPALLFVFGVNWAVVFNVSPVNVDASVIASILILTFAFLVGLPLSVVEKVRAAKQELYIHALYQMAGNILSVIGLCLVVWKGGSLQWLVAALVCPGHLANLANGAGLLAKYPELRPSPRLYDASVARKMISLGLYFFGLQVLGVLTFQGDNFIATHMFGPGSVTPLSLHARLFSIIQMMMNVATVPLWGAYSEAIARRDFQWVRWQFRRSIWFNIGIGGAACLGLTVVGSPLLRIWLHNRVTPSVPLLAALGLWTVLQCVGTATAMLLNGANWVRFQLKTATVLGIIAVPLKILLARKFGLLGIPVGGSLAYILSTIIPVIIVMPGLIKGLERKPGLPEPAPAR